MKHSLLLLPPPLLPSTQHYHQAAVLPAPAPIVPVLQQYHQPQYHQLQPQPQYHQAAHYEASAPLLVRRKQKEDKQDLSKIPGVPGHDFPIYRSVPPTSFSCHNVPAVPGMYANPETGCQAYHVCNDGRDGEQGSSFLCSNGTLFNQELFACDWWYNVSSMTTYCLYSASLVQKGRIK